MSIIKNTLLDRRQIAALTDAHYSIGNVRFCKLIRRGYNDHYLVRSEDQEYVFRVYLNHKYYIESPDAFHFELDLLDHLSSEGVSVASALQTNDNCLLGWTQTELGDRAFALFPYARGRKIGFRRIGPRRWFELGRTMAEIHLSSDRFHSERQRYQLDLDYLLHEPLRLIGERGISKRERRRVKRVLESLGLIENLVRTIEDLDTGQGEFGIIHGDLHSENVHFRGDDPVVFDFDHCAYGWRAYDLAISFDLPDTKREAMLKGYLSHRPLSDRELECLPTFSKLRDLWNIGDWLATKELRARKP